MRDRFERIQALIKAEWNGQHVPILALHGSQCRLDHPRGGSVIFDLKRDDLLLNEAEFITKIIKPAIAKLRELAK